MNQRVNKRQYVVRVVQTHTPATNPDDSYVVQAASQEINEGGIIDDSFLECLRYAGLVRVHQVDPHGLTTRCFDLVCPAGNESDIWAERVAQKMQSFGYNAVKAPSTE